MAEYKKISILGSTGSIGTQTLDIIRNFPERFKAVLLTAKSNWELLARQAKEFKPLNVAINDVEYLPRLREALRDEPIQVWAGEDEISRLAGENDADIVVTATTGYSGFLPTINAIKASKTIALANKETLVVGGALIMPLAQKYKASIIPVDSEHSAIFQCLVGEDPHKLRRIFLTASGGPFRTWTKAQMKNASVKDALKHPNWSMGAKVTVDSASMMNKGNEMIEAKWLFDCEPENIEIIIHPQSIVHSMVEFCDGSVKAQFGVPDMHLPIRYALGFPERLPADSGFLKISDFSNLTFEAPDFEKFPMLSLAFHAIEKGGNMPCILNAANEIAVEEFLKEKISFMDIPRLVEWVMTKIPFIQSPSLEQLVATNSEAVEIARQWKANAK